MQELRSELLSSSSPRPSSASQGWGSWQARPLCVNLCPLHPGSLLMGEKDKPTDEGGHGRSRLQQEPGEAFSPLPSQLPFMCLIPQRPKQSDCYQCLSQEQGHHPVGCELMALLKHPKEVNRVNFLLPFRSLDQICTSGWSCLSCGALNLGKSMCLVGQTLRATVLFGTGTIFSIF